jgi:hypothetical protein
VRPAGRAARRALAVAAALLLAAPATHAGRPCDDAPLTAVAVERGLALAARTLAALDASGATVVLLARAGQDLSAHGLRWSHLGFAYRDGDAPGAPWRVLHKLNPHPNQFALLRQRRFAPFFWVQFLGAGNDNVFKFAFTVLVTYQLQVSWLPPAMAGLVIGALFILPFLLFSATSGQLADKWPTRRG